MDNLDIKDELQILKAASLDGMKAPETLDTVRAREFVHSSLEAQRKARRRGFFSSPFLYVSMAVCACALVAAFVFFPSGGTTQDLMMQESFHAASDSLSTQDSISASATESVELMVVDE